MAIAYLASFASEICKDAGAGSLASKVEFSGKMFILVFSNSNINGCIRLYITNFVGVNMKKFKRLMILLVINICIFSIISPTAIVNAEEENKSAIETIVDEGMIRS